MQLTFHAVSETWPGGRWQTLFRRYWPAYRAWFLRRADRAGHGPDADASRRALGRAMPELLAVYDRLVELTGDDPLAARLLSGYRPPPYLIGCSQAALVRPAESVLVRNYDLHPSLNEGLILYSRWRGRSVVASSEFLWGAADGMNEAGLALSLAFGGRRELGDGFGIPMILRYLLEVCDDVDEAIDALHRVPSHMAYNVTLLDRHGSARTVQVGPGRRPTLLDAPVATNHQGRPQWHEHARFTASVEREQRLHQRLAERDLDSAALLAEFARRPLYNVDYQNGFGTLYTAAYRPLSGVAEWHWPGAVWGQALTAFEEGQRVVDYTPHGALVGERAPADAGAYGRHGDAATAWYRSRSDRAAGGPWADPRLRAWCEDAGRHGRADWARFGRSLGAIDWSRYSLPPSPRKEQGR